MKKLFSILVFNSMAALAYGQINMQTSPNPAANTNNPTQLPVSMMDTAGSINATNGVGIEPARDNGTYMSDSLAKAVEDKQTTIRVTEKATPGTATPRKSTATKNKKAK